MTLQINTTTVIDASRNLTNIANQTSFVSTNIATAGFDAVGQYTFAWRGTGPFTNGSTYAGSTLFTGGFWNGGGTLAAGGSTGTAHDGFRSGTSLTGTWRAHGDSYDGTRSNHWTLFIRTI